MLALKEVLIIWYYAAQRDFNSQLSATWAIDDAVLLNAYKGNVGNSFLQTRLIIENKFLQKNVTGKNRLQLTFFGDANAKGNWDPGKIALPGCNV